MFVAKREMDDPNLDYVAFVSRRIQKKSEYHLPSDDKTLSREEVFRNSLLPHHWDEKTSVATMADSRIKVNAWDWVMNDAVTCIQNKDDIIGEGGILYTAFHVAGNKLGSSSEWKIDLAENDKAWMVPFPSTTTTGKTGWYFVRWTHCSRWVAMFLNDAENSLLLA